MGIPTNYNIVITSSYVTKTLKMEHHVFYTIMDVELKEETVEVLRININGNSFKPKHVDNFLEEVKGTDGFVSVRWRRKYEDIAEELKDMGIVEENASGSWFSTDDEKIEELQEKVSEARDEFYS